MHVHVLCHHSLKINAKILSFNREKGPRPLESIIDTNLISYDFSLLTSAIR